MTLAAYRPLGRSGLVVSPLALGTMTFGTGRWGTDAAASRAIFDAYVDAGGNIVDTADVYSGGRSEELIGSFVADRGLRDQLVIATKSGFGTAKHPHGGGNGAKHIHAALDGSLRRLGTDFVDLYWVHVWDMVTPAEELLQTLAALVQSGKIRYYGLSNVPAWYAAQLATLAAARGLPGPVALQFEYSLVERGVEREHLPAAAALGLAVQPWSPLGGGFLSGKYHRDDPATTDGGAAGGAPSDDEGRLAGPNPFGDTKFTPRNWDVLDTLLAVATETGRPPAQVALAWLVGRPHVAATLIGASRAAQIADNVAALDIILSAEQRARLAAASAPSTIFTDGLFTPAVNRMVFGGATVTPWR